MPASPIRTIVVPADCSQLSLNALRYADWLAVRSGAKVIAVYGANFSRPDGEGVAAALVSREDIEMMMAPVRRCIEDGLAQTLSKDTAHDIVLLDAEPADAIVSVANERDAGLIIMGTHDRNRLMRAVLGSVTDTVLHMTDRPVLILREQNRIDGENPIRRVLCPFGNRPASIAALTEARVIADAAGAELTTIHVVRPGDESSPSADPDARQVVIGDNGGDQIIGIADEMKADLIVLGTEHRRFSDPTVLGRPSSQIVRMAHCPVLAVTR